LALVNGRFACAPGNHIVWSEVSFVDKSADKSWLRVQNKTWHAEEPKIDPMVTEATG
jgi:hypothetical protein